MQAAKVKPLVHYDAPEVAGPNQELFRLVVEQGPDAIIFADRQGVIEIWNDAAAGLFGYLRKEAIGQSLDIIIPERLRQAHWDGFGTAIASGQSRHGRSALRTKAMHKTGHNLYVSLAFSIVKDRQGLVIGAMATARRSPEKSGPRELDRDGAPPV